MVTLSKGQLEEDSAFLQFMKRVDRELSAAQSYLYNITDDISIGINIDSSGISIGSPDVDVDDTPSQNINNNTRLSPIPLSPDNPQTPSKNEDYPG